MRIGRLLSALFVLAAVPACKKKSARDDEAMAKFVEFKDRMCACKDKACADQVQDQMTRWGQEMAKSRPGKMNEADMKKMQEVGAQYGECFSARMGSDGGSAAPPAPSERITNADRLIKHTYDSVGPRSVATFLVSYVRADGTIDDTFGEAVIDTGLPKPPEPKDDPNRPIGAPVVRPPTAVPDPNARCPMTRWKKGTPEVTMGSCVMLGDGLARPKCSVVEVWKRAIDKGAPPGALAVLELHSGTPQSWKFQIEDEPRNIHISIDVDDTCEPTLEAPR